MQSFGARVPRDWAVLVALVALVVLLVVPLPTTVVDIALVGNLAFALALLVAAVLVPQPLAFSAFPTLLVLATLLRIGLNVATTRLILAHGDAGQVVRAFGDSVAAGNVVVGLVVFVVISAVLLLVIARGGERVAEVAARFALDALPGKQHALDAAVRQGELTSAAAATQRARIESESHLLGSLDGAMRFVKGDALAALVIVAVNLLGGLALGVAMQGLTLREASARYIVLSIGEGLLAQIPSLLSAVAAALLVTRSAVTAGVGRAHRHGLFGQLFSTPQALTATALAIGLLAWLPGLPVLPFTLVASLLACGVWWQGRYRRRARSWCGAPAARMVVGVPRETALAPETWRQLAALVCLRTGFVPSTLRCERRQDDAPEITLTLDGTPLTTLGWGRTQASSATVVAGAGGAGSELAISAGAWRAVWARVGAGAEPGAAPEAGAGVGSLGADAHGDDTHGLDAVANVTHAGYASAIPTWVREAAAALAGALDAWLSLDEVAAALRQVAERNPVLVQETVPVRVDLRTLTAILRELASEGVPLLDLVPVLGAIAALPTGDVLADAPTLERIRTQLRRQISHQWAPHGELLVLTLDDMIEDAVRSAVTTRAGVAELALEAEIAGDIIAAVRAATRAPDAAQVILTSADVRRPLRGLLAIELPQIAVLAPNELLPGTLVKAVGRVNC